MFMMKVAFILAMCLAALLSASGCSDKLTAFRPGRKAADDTEAKPDTPKRSARAGKKSEAKTKAEADEFSDLAELSPEASMRQGLARLAEKEREQENNVKEMRETLTQGVEIVRQEEERLMALREQRQKYEEALAAYGPSQTAATMAAMPAPRQKGRARNLALENNAAGTQLAEGERMIYNPMVDNPLPRAGGWPMEDPDMAMAPAQAAERRAPQPSRADLLDDDIQWNPPRTAARRPAIAEMPQTGEMIVSRPEPLAQAQTEQLQPQPQPRPTRARAPERDRATTPAPAVATARTMTQVEDDAAVPSTRMGGVFVPDLVLGGA